MCVRITHSILHDDIVGDAPAPTARRRTAVTQASSASLAKVIARGETRRRAGTLVGGRVVRALGKPECSRVRIRSAGGRLCCGWWSGSCLGLSSEFSVIAGSYLLWCWRLPPPRSPRSARSSRRSLKILDTTTFAFFFFVLVSVVGFRWMVLATHMSLLVNMTLTAIAWGSLLAGTPFTIQSSREQVAPNFGTRRSSSASTDTSPLFGASTSSSRCWFRSTGRSRAIRPRVALRVGSLSLGAAVFTVYFPAWYRARAIEPGGGQRARIAFERPPFCE